MWDRPHGGESPGRLVAHADRLCAPRITSPDLASVIADGVAPKSVNLPIHRPCSTPAEGADAGVRRISVGGMPATTAWRGSLAAALEIADPGTLAQFVDLPGPNGFLSPSGSLHPPDPYAPRRRPTRRGADRVTSAPPAAGSG